MTPTPPAGRRHACRRCAQQGRPFAGNEADGSRVTLQQGLLALVTSARYGAGASDSDLSGFRAPRRYLQRNPFRVSSGRVLRAPRCNHPGQIYPQPSFSGPKRPIQVVLRAKNHNLGQRFKGLSWSAPPVPPITHAPETSSCASRTKASAAVRAGRKADVADVVHPRQHGAIPATQVR